MDRNLSELVLEKMKTMNRLEQAAKGTVYEKGVGNAEKKKADDAAMEEVLKDLW